jgi:hypothetical protein
MIDTLPIKVTVAFTDPNLAESERELQLRELQAEVETVAKVTSSVVPPGSKAFASFLTGLLMAEINGENIKKLLDFLSDRFGNQPLEISLEKPDGSKIFLKANSREELEYLIKQTQEFLKPNSGSPG